MISMPAGLRVLHQYLRYTAHRIQEAIHLRGGVVYGKGGSHSAGYVEPLHEGLSTVMARTHRNTHLIQEQTYVVGVRLAQQEG
jgi:hypothetical protein